MEGRPLRSFAKVLELSQKQGAQHAAGLHMDLLIQLSAADLEVFMAAHLNRVAVLHPGRVQQSTGA